MQWFFILCTVVLLYHETILRKSLYKNYRVLQISKLLDKLRNESRNIYYKRCCNSVGCFPIDHNTNLNIVIVALASFKTLYVNHNIVVAS